MQCAWASGLFTLAMCPEPRWIDRLGSVRCRAQRLVGIRATGVVIEAYIIRADVSNRYPRCHALCSYLWAKGKLADVSLLRCLRNDKRDAMP